MDWIVVAGVKPYDGRYELDTEREFTTREWGWIKRLSGYLPLTLTDDAFGDPELMCVLAAIMLQRAGRVERTEVPTVFDRLADAPFGSTITIENEPVDQEEGDAGPPSRSSNGNEPASGESSAASSETSEPIPPASGIPASASSPSGPARSAI